MVGNLKLLASGVGAMSSSFPWPAWPARKDGKEDLSTRNEFDEIITKATTKLDTISPSALALTSFALGSVTAIASAMTYYRYGKRIRTSEWLTPNILRKKRWLKGVVTSVGDADNFRLYHTPSLGGYHWPFKFRRIPSITKDLKDQTIHIRIAGVDAPEAAHFGREAQPYAVESLAWLRKAILGRTLYCQVLRRDQYGRIVAYVQYPPRLLPGYLASGKSLALEMLKAGWVTTYEQAGAEYGKWDKSEYLRIEAEAKAARKGMWKSGVKLESPAEYKRRHAQSVSVETAEPATVEKKSWWRRLLAR